MKVAFQDTFYEAVEESNQRAKGDPDVKKALEEYDGRTFVLNIVDDTTYMLKITRDGVSLTVSPPEYPKDMYVETDEETVRKVIQSRGSIAELLFIAASGKVKSRNIGPKEISLVRKLLRK